MCIRLVTVISQGLTFVLGNYAAPDLGWRSVFLLGCVWGVPVAIALFFFSDPRYMIKWRSLPLHSILFSQK